MGQQRFHLTAEVFVSGTRLPDKLASPAFFHLQGSVKDLFDSSPTFTLHRVSLRSVPAAARPWLAANPASQLRAKPSTPPRFPPRSGLQKSASRPPGSYARPPSRANSERHPRRPNRHSPQGRPPEPHLARPVALRCHVCATAGPGPGR